MSVLPPGPRGVIRNTMRAMMDPYGFYADNGKKYGDIFTAKTFNGTIICCLNPATIRTLFSQPIGSYGPFGVDAATPLVGKGSVMTNGGEVHRAQRQLLSPPFKASRMAVYGPGIAATVSENIDKMVAGQQINMLSVGNQISLETIIRAVFGVQKDAERERFIQAIYDFVAATNPLFIFCKPLQREFFGMGPWAKFQRTQKHLLQLLRNVINERRQQQHVGEDILSRLLIQVDDEGNSFTEEALLDNLMTLLFAGHETTGIALSWAMYWLHREPAVRERLIDELELNGDELSLEKINSNKWMDAVNKETLRLNPILADVLRTVEKPMELQGYQLGPGLSVAAGIGGVHYNEELYPEPHRFNPERFMERTFSPWEYMPFGGGLRRCPGSAFATYELKIAVAILLQRCSFRLEQQQIVAARKNLTMAPKGGVPLTVMDIRAASNDFRVAKPQLAYS